MEVLGVTAGLLLVALVGTPWPSYRSRECEIGSSCLSNARMIGTAARMYVQDYDERLPPADYATRGQLYTLPALLDPYTKNGGAWRCPNTPRSEEQTYRFDGNPGDTTVNYGYNWPALAPNGSGVHSHQVRHPDETVLFAETRSYRAVPSMLTVTYPGTVPEYAHPAGCTVTWWSGRTGRVPVGKLEQTSSYEGLQTLGGGIDAYSYWNRK